MVDLSEKLGLPDAKEVTYSIGDEFTSTVGSGDIGTGCVEADRRATVEALARWLMGQGYGGDRLTRGEVANLIERELLSRPGPEKP